jgi:hypothetical protein
LKRKREIISTSWTLRDEYRRRDEEKGILMAALRAEIVGLMDTASKAMQNARMMQRFYEALAKGRTPAVTKSFIAPTFEAPVYRANISKLGLLGASLGADVVKVMAPTGVKVEMAFDIPMDHDMIATLHEGLADRSFGDVGSTSGLTKVDMDG